MRHHENRSSGSKNRILDDYRNMSFYLFYHLNVRRRHMRLEKGVNAPAKIIALKKSAKHA